MKSLAICLFFFMLFVVTGNAQSPAIKCYFNHPVNNSISSGRNAAYLNGTFPDTIAAYINRAKQSIDICMYNYTAFSASNVAKIANAINAAFARGILIRWIYNGTSATNNSGLSLLNSNIKTFPSANINNYIMHNKFMIIDVNSSDSADAILQTGSYNFSDQQTTGDNNNIIFIQSKQVAMAFYKEFNKMWGGPGLNPDIANSTFSTNKSASSQNIFDINGTIVEVYFSPKDLVGSKLQNSINSAQHDLFFGVFTFTDNGIANLIKDKYNSGLFVRGIMDEFSLTFNAYAILNPVLGKNMLINAGNNLYHDKTMLVDALHTASDPQVFTGSFNWTNQAQVSNDENAIIIHDAAIANQYYQSLCKNYTTLGGVACVAPPCPGANNILISNARGNTYQWQLNTGSGFVNITSNSFYSRTDTINLTINNPPSSWYGYQYRCLVNGTQFSDTTTLRFTTYWNGSSSSAWENTSNWNCGLLPDENTDVVVGSNVQFFPKVNLSTVCRSLKLLKGGMAIITAGIQLFLTGK